MSHAPGAQRLVVYALETVRGRVDDYVFAALSALTTVSTPLVVVVPHGVAEGERARLLEVADRVHEGRGKAFAPSDYASALTEARDLLENVDEVVLTGDSWFGPLVELRPLLSNWDAESEADVWSMVGIQHGPPPSFPTQGFFDVLSPWLWTSFRASVVRSADWDEYWAVDRDARDALLQESSVLAFFAARGYSVDSMFRAEDYPSGDPALYNARHLIADGFPFVGRLQFRLFPPFLDQHAVLGAEMLEAMARAGADMAPVMQNLARSVRPKALNTVAATVDVLPEVAPTPAEREVLVVAHVSDFEDFGQLQSAMSNIPIPYDLVITTIDGTRGAQLQAFLAGEADPRRRSLEIRVTPDAPGRDMSDFFVGCRDLLLSGRYDLVVKIHARRAPRKTVNRLRYLRRYQLENLLGSPAQVAGIISLFERESGLGLVFPPMMHVGYSIAGRGWAGLERQADRVRESLGIDGPIDLVSPLAPFGGMWIARSEALRRMAEHPWKYSDYRGGGGSRRTAHVQERLLAEAAATDGFHVRTVLTPEHAAISHTALEYKLDDIGRSFRGYPLDQILFTHTAGRIEAGGATALLRMYLNLNHPRVLRLFSPFVRTAHLATRVVHRVERTGSRLGRVLMAPEGGRR